jgi:serine/threonine protein kinase
MICVAGRPFRESVLLRLFLGVCAAVRELHAAQPAPLAHRDIKPHNVLLEERGRRRRKGDEEEELVPVLMDLGSVAPARLKIRSHRCESPTHFRTFVSLNARGSTPSSEKSVTL